MCFAPYQEKVKLNSQFLAVAGGGRKTPTPLPSLCGHPTAPLILITLSLSPEQEVRSV